MMSHMNMDAFREKYCKLVEKKCKVGGADECWPWQGKKVDGYGIQSVVWPASGKRREMNVARVVLIIKLGTFLEADSGDSSHLCHTRDCCNPKHIVLESRSLNCERKHCRAQGRCTKAHEPYCIL